MNPLGACMAAGNCDEQIVLWLALAVSVVVFVWIGVLLPILNSDRWMRYQARRLRNRARRR